MAAILGSLFNTCIAVAFWVFVIRLIVKNVARKESDKKIETMKEQHAETMSQLAAKHAFEYYTAISQAETARQANAALLADLPPPGIPQARSEAVDLQAVETAAYAIVMQAHEEGWIDGSDFGDLAAAEARKSERASVPAAAIAKYAAELRLRGGFGREV